MSIFLPPVDEVVQTLRSPQTRRDEAGYLNKIKYVCLRFYYIQRRGIRYAKWYLKRKLSWLPINSHKLTIYTSCPIPIYNPNHPVAIPQ